MRKYDYERMMMLMILLLAWWGGSPAPVAAQDLTACDTSSRYLYWTGEVNQDFFDENNWRIAIQKPTPGVESSFAACAPGGKDLYPYSICPVVPDLANDRKPRAGTLEPGQPIRFNLLIENAHVSANGAIVFACPLKGLTLVGSQLDATGMQQGVLSLTGESTAHLREGEYSNTLKINFLDAASWVYAHEANPQEMEAHLSNILVGYAQGTPNGNFRINQYYQAGSVIRPIDAAFAALTISDGTATAGLSEDVIYKGGQIPGGLEDAVSSFVLKRGYMATLANHPNGTGKSKVYIASEADLVVDELPVAMQGNVSFIRVVPWNWVTKKGTGGFYDQLDAGWYYNWGLGSQSLPNYEYVPMAWGAGGALPNSINTLIQKDRATHLLGFNESDNCEDQSGKFNNLCEPAVAVAYYENLMGTGLRLGTPAPRENGPTGWLAEFARIAKERDVRFDFVAVHWYDWGSSPANSPNADPQVIFNRFKNYLENVYRIYQLPIWITEFNANPNRGNATQEAFLRLALPYLESLDYVERYAYFQPNSQFASVPTTSANYLDTNGNLTNIGELYLAHPSTPSIPETTYESPNNLAAMDVPFVPQPVNVMAFEAECGLYLGNQWAVTESETASNGLYIRGDAGLPGASALAKQVHLEFELAEAGTYRVWIRAANVSGNGTIRIAMDGKTLEQITPLNSASFDWLQIPRFYTLGAGKHRLTLEFPSASLLLDQIALTDGLTDLQALVQPAGTCTPTAPRWGLEASDLMAFYEAEQAALGASWALKSAPNAIGGAGVQSDENAVATALPADAETVLTFNVEVAQSDEYEIWAKIQALGSGERSLWISVDGEPFRKWDGLGNATFEWYWKKFYFSYPNETRNLSFFLSAGAHQVQIAASSGSVAVDRIAVATKGKLPESVDPNVVLLFDNLDFEAENARLLGTAFVVACATSSNGAQVNMRTSATNGVLFDQIVAVSGGTYVLNIAYMSKVSRIFRVLVNGQATGQRTAAPSGNWCFEGGSPGNYQMEVTLVRGQNTIQITPNFTGDAPFIDRITLTRSAGARLTDQLATEATVNETFAVYPNPVQVGTALMLNLPQTAENTPVSVQISDLAGRSLLMQTMPSQAEPRIELGNHISKGLYILTVRQGQHRWTQKIVVE